MAFWRIPTSVAILFVDMILYHASTEKKAKAYRKTGAILRPVRGFTTLQSAMAWTIQVGRKVIYQIEGEPAYKLPDHHNEFGEAWWIDNDVKQFQKAYSATKNYERKNNKAERGRT